MSANASHKKVCNMDCFHCPYPDCINDSAPTTFEKQILRTVVGSDDKQMEKLRAENPAFFNTDNIKPSHPSDVWLCVECGAEIPVDPKYRRRRTICDACKAKHAKKRSEKLAKRRKYRREHGLCTICGKQVEQRFLTGTLCADCYAKQHHYNKERYSNHKDEVQAANKRYYAQNKELVNAQCKQYYQEHKQERSDYHKRWWAENRKKTLSLILILLLLSVTPSVHASKALAEHEQNKGRAYVINTVGKTGLMSDYNLYLLSHLIYGESGSDWCSDTMQLYVGSVVINRVNSDIFPNTLYGVIYQRGQYQCTWDGNYDLTPNDRAIKNAQYILRNGSVLPQDVVTQSEIRMPKVYTKIQNMWFGYRW